MKLEVLDSKGKNTGRSVNLPKEIFGIEPNDHVVYLAVKQYLANQRQGTHKAKERGEIAGSTRKIKRQKGTGTARAGSIKNPLFRGGGRVFGPRPRTYKVGLNKKVKSLARKSVLSLKATDGNIVVVEDLSFDAPKTKNFVDVLTSLNVAGEKTLVVIPSYNKEVYLSSRNFPKSQVITASDLNVYEIMHANKLVLAEGAIEKIKEIYA